MSVPRLPVAPPVGAAAWPDLADVFGLIPLLAREIAVGHVLRDTALDAIRADSRVRIAFRRRHPRQRYEFSGLWTDLAWCLDGAIGEAKRDRYAVIEAVQREVAPLLDRRASRADVIEAAGRANQDGYLTPAEITRLVDHETAWWVRLHAATLMQEARVA